MGRLIRWFIVLVVVAGGGFLLWQQTRTKPIEVAIRGVVRGTVEKTVANTRAGTVEACRRARLSPSIGGQIANLPIAEGDLVEEGELLLELWNKDLLAQLEVATAEGRVASAQAQATCQRADEARRQAARAKLLFDRQVGSREQKEIAVTEATSLEAQCKAARASEETAVAGLALAKAGLDRSRLTAPFAGIIARIEGELSEFVTPSPVGVQTPPVIDLIENSCFYVSAPIDEVDAAAVAVGMPVRISLDAYRGRTFPGKVRRIAPYVLDLEKQARTVAVEVSFAQPEDFADLLAGYSADVEIVLETRSDTLKFPSEAVIGEKWVYLLDEATGVVRKVEFTAGLANWVETEAISGLKEGDLVVTSVDDPKLQDGAAAVRFGEPQ